MNGGEPGPRILIADDQAGVLEALRLLLKPEGYQIETAAWPAQILAALESREFDVVLMDLNYACDTTSGREGLDLLSRIHAMDSRLPVVLMTAWGTIDLAVEAMRRGARDFVQKPWDNLRLLAILRPHRGRVGDHDGAAFPAQQTVLGLQSLALAQGAA